MKFPKVLFGLAIISLLTIIPITLYSQGTLEDYKRADEFRTMVSGLVYNSIDRVNWIENTNGFWYLNNIREGKEFILVDADEKERGPAFDHKKLAESLSLITGEQYAPYELPFSSIIFLDSGDSIRFTAEDFQWTYNLKTNECTRGDSVGRSAFQRGARGESGREFGSRRGRESTSPDGKFTAFIRDYNLFVRSADTGGEIQMSFDGEEGNYYSSPILWSPDSKKLVTNYTEQGKETIVYLIESSPDEQLRPKMRSRSYALPGDTLTIGKPCLFHIEDKMQIKIEDALFADPYNISNINWNSDSGQFTFRFQQRGEQLARIIAVNAATGVPRTIIEEREDTFVDRYNQVMQYISGGSEIIWGSERDGWKHLYLYDAKEGKLKNRITEGQWVVRGIEYVDEEARRIYFRASGKEAGHDPYLVHYYRINLDGTGLIRLTEGNGNHSVNFSPDRKYFVDTFSRIDLPPVSVLRRTSDGSLVMELERADITSLLETGWKIPEPFMAKGRDGKTDIWGVIYRPTNFDESKKYPVIEKIYAGPHSSFVPKTFSAYRADQALTELGFIVVQIDGMGTANRSKAFHDVAWQNIADAGFPDRILWMKAAAHQFPYIDLTRVGIFGHSAGGQNSTGALLFHPEFYKVAVSSCGCHDNRMDKAVWNEQWMGYPVGPHYEEQSNVTNAHKLKGKLFLIVGELDTNVPPQSTLQVVDALIKAGKDFELLVLPGQGHSSGGDYGERRKRDFFVKHLLGVEPPNWNEIEK